MLASENIPMYRVEWQSKHTGYTGHGEWLADIGIVLSAIDWAQEQDTVCNYWVGIKKNK